MRSGFGQYLLHSRGSAATYELSSQSSQIDEFLSHSWSSSGRLKWLSLCLHHNGVAAVSAALIAGVLATVLEIAGLGTLPVVRHRWFDGQIRSIVFGPYLAAYSAFDNLIYASALERFRARVDAARVEERGETGSLRPGDVCGSEMAPASSRMLPRRVRARGAPFVTTCAPGVRGGRSARGGVCVHGMRLRGCDARTCGWLGS